jgi:hypothetical protein
MLCEDVVVVRLGRHQIWIAGSDRGIGCLIWIDDGGRHQVTNVGPSPGPGYTPGANLYPSAIDIAEPRWGVH